MLKKLIRPGLILSLVGLAVVVAALTLRTRVNAMQHREEIHIESFAWGVSESQSLRICMSNLGSGSSAGPRESITFVFARIKFPSGDVALEKSLSVPQGQFRCTDFSHSELIAAGLVPESNSRVQFLVTIGINESLSVGAAQAVTVGAAQSISIDAGKTEIYKTIQTRQTTVIQDL